MVGDHILEPFNRSTDGRGPSFRGLQTPKPGSRPSGRGQAATREGTTGLQAAVSTTPYRSPDLYQPVGVQGSGPDIGMPRVIPPIPRHRCSTGGLPVQFEGVDAVCFPKAPVTKCQLYPCRGDPLLTPPTMSRRYRNSAVCVTAGRTLGLASLVGLLLLRV